MYFISHAHRTNMLEFTVKKSDQFLSTPPQFGKLALHNNNPNELNIFMGEL